MQAPADRLRALAAVPLGGSRAGGLLGVPEAAVQRGRADGVEGRPAVEMQRAKGAMQEFEDPRSDTAAAVSRKASEHAPVLEA